MAFWADRCHPVLVAHLLQRLHNLRKRWLNQRHHGGFHVRLHIGLHVGNYFWYYFRNYFRYYLWVHYLRHHCGYYFRQHVGNDDFG